MNWRADRGSATVMLLAAMALCMVVGMVALAMTEFASARARVSAAADLAALSAASRALYSDGCDRASEVARENDAVLRSCHLEGTDAVVAVEGRARGVLARLARMAGKSAPQIVVDARAGQPESVTKPSSTGRIVQRWAPGISVHPMRGRTWKSPWQPEK